MLLAVIQCFTFCRVSDEKAFQLDTRMSLLSHVTVSIFCKGMYLKVSAFLASANVIILLVVTIFLNVQRKPGLPKWLVNRCHKHNSHGFGW